MWSKVEQVLQYTESSKEDAFTKFLKDRYFSLIDEECANQARIASASSVALPNIKPFVEPEFQRQHWKIENKS